MSISIIEPLFMGRIWCSVCKLWAFCSVKLIVTTTRSCLKIFAYWYLCSPIYTMFFPTPDHLSILKDLLNTIFAVPFARCYHLSIFKDLLNTIFAVPFARCFFPPKYHLSSLKDLLNTISAVPFARCFPHSSTKLHVEGFHQTSIYQRDHFQP